jgi:hypothetical protein
MSKRITLVPSSPGIRRRITVTVIEVPEAAPDTLNLRCPRHRPPQPMHPIGVSQSASGESLVLYACADPHCRYREGWGQDPRTGALRRLIRGFDEGRR